MTEGYVYLIGTPIFGWYKIGKSRTPEVRVKDLGILLPFKVEIIGVWKAVNHHLMESTLHEMYKTNKINGEWFVAPIYNEAIQDSKKIKIFRVDKMMGLGTPEDLEYFQDNYKPL